MVTNISHSPLETEALGEQWGKAAQPGLLIALCGDLGAGKTQLVKGLARGLGITARVQSPTFALINSYAEGRLPLFHLDLYRLDTPQQVVAAGLEEYLNSTGVAVIEWAERWFVSRPDSRTVAAQGFARPDQSAGFAIHRILRWVDIEIIDESQRRISHEDFGD